MFKVAHISRYCLVFLLLGLCEISSADEGRIPSRTAIEILEFIDGAFLSGETYELFIESETYRQHKRRPDVRTIKLLDDGKDSTIVEFMDGPERGQKVLSTRQEVWFFAPRTKRAIKVPSAQRIFGNASIGDIARLRLSKDYNIVSTKRENPSYLYIDLQAKSNVATYQSILLKIDAHTYLPVQADYSVASGKRVKRGIYEKTEIVDGILQRRIFRIEDTQKENSYTRIIFKTAKQIKLPPNSFSVRRVELGL